MILELELAAVVYYMPASSSHMVRGLYYVFLGTFTFAVIQWDSVIGIIIMIIGIVLTVFGLAHCFYPMLEERAVAAGFLVRCGMENVSCCFAGIFLPPFASARYTAGLATNVQGGSRRWQRASVEPDVRPD